MSAGFKVGDKIIRLDRRFVGGEEKELIVTNTVTKVRHQTIHMMWVDHHHKEEDCLYQVYAYPDIPESRQFLQDKLDLNARHKKEQAEFMSRTYEFNNELIRKGLK